MPLKEALNIIRGWTLAIRNDPEGVSVLRTLLLGLVLCACAYLAGTSLLVTPKQKEYEELHAARQKLLQSTPDLNGNRPDATLAQLDVNIRSLREKITINRLKEKLYTEQWRTISDPEQFTKSVFTLYPSAPIKMGDSLRKANTMEPRKLATYSIYPILIEGTASFARLFDYLRYLESNSSVSLIDDLTIESKPAGENQPAGSLHFLFQVGRIGLAETMQPAPQTTGAGH
ncbi:MAG: hypothetical protein A2521_05480 [Deltaproteobacteria bacterium RIFOXYD12_FULL_57_12]|nr:MAG: hypothetical protein A2521_05480 [Deltaproteobacteria bacterium RIFOXYD12_FULL_57_12]